ncbi:hypothetical protein [Sideroxyarcus sp. TK5]
MNLVQKALDMKFFDAQPSESWQHIEALLLRSFKPLMVLLVVNALLVITFRIDATLQLLFDWLQLLALCHGIFSIGAACFKVFMSAMISAALRWIGSGRVGYLCISTIHVMMNSLNALLQRMEVQSIRAVVRVRIALGIVHPSLFARLIPTPIFRRA